MMTTPPDKPSPNRVLVLWIIWLAITVELLVLQFTIGDGLPLGKNEAGSSPPVFAYIAIAEILAATAVRWFVVTRCREFAHALVAMIIGLALSESAAILGVFLLPPTQPQTKLLVFVLAFFGVLQFAPIYARNLAHTLKVPAVPPVF